MKVEITVFSRESNYLDALDQFLAGSPEMDQIGDGADFEPMLFGESDEFGQARHRTVIAHDLADHGDGAAAGQLHQIYRRFRMSGALQHTAGPRAQWKYMTWLG